MRRALAALFLFLLILPGPALAAEAEASGTSIFLIRHAEKESGDDPGLTDLGRRRADALATLLARASVTHIYSTEYRRTRATVEELARRTGVEVTVVPAREGARQVEILRALPPGSVAVVTGHSNTVPGMVRALGGEAPDLEESDYGDLFLVRLPAGGGGVSTLRLFAGPGAPAASKAAGVAAGTGPTGSESR